MTIGIIGMERKRLLGAVPIKGGIKCLSGQERKRRRWGHCRRFSFENFQIPYL